MTMYISLVFRTFITLMLVLNVYARHTECPKLSSACSCYGKYKGKPSDVECRGLRYKELKSAFDKIHMHEFGKFEIVRSKLSEVNQTMFSNVSMHTLEFKFCEVETFHLFEGLSSLINLNTLIFDYVNVKRWVFTSAEEIGEFSQMRQFILLDCPETNGNDTHIIRYLPKNLTSITIRWCGLNSEEEHSFRHFSNLQKLDLANNLLTSVNRSYLPLPALHLQFYSLSHNPINSLPDDMFEDMPALNTVHLESTPLTTLPYDAFKPVLNRLNSLQISNNPLNCDCYNSWILTVVLNLDSQIARCASPENLKDRKLDDITPKEMCQPDVESYRVAMDEYCSNRFDNATSY